MAEIEVAPTAIQETTEKTTKKKARMSAKKPGCSASDIIKSVVCTKERKGMSFYLIKKAASAQGYDVEHMSGNLKRALKKLLQSGELIQVKGNGACGSVKLASKPTVKAKKPVVKKAAVKAKKPAPKKAAVKAKKPAAKKAVTARARPKGTPKKVKPTTAAKKPASKKKASLKTTAKKTTAKKTTAKKTTAKKTTVKKTTVKKTTAKKTTAKKTTAKKPAKK